MGQGRGWDREPGAGSREPGAGSGGPSDGESGQCGVSGESGSVKCEGFVYIYIDGDGCKGGGAGAGGKCEGFVFLYAGECEM